MSSSPHGKRCVTMVVNDLAMGVNPHDWPLGKGIILTLDPSLVGSVLVEAGQIVPRRQATMSAINVSPLDIGLLDAVVRLVRLLDSRIEARFLAPLIKREIVYRLLLGEQGGRLSQITALGDATHRIAEAIQWLRRNFDQPLRIEELARAFGMSVSGFHHHFRALTAMSPLQFQKQLRLQEARRRVLRCLQVLGICFANQPTL